MRRNSITPSRAFCVLAERVRTTCPSAAGKAHPDRPDIIDHLALAVGNGYFATIEHRQLQLIGDMLRDAQMHRPAIDQRADRHRQQIVLPGIGQFDVSQDDTHGLVLSNMLERVEHGGVGEDVDFGAVSGDFRPQSGFHRR